MAAPGSSSKDALYRLRQEDVVEQQLDDVTVLLDLRTSLYLELNATATVLLPLLVAGARLEALVQTVTDRWGVEQEVAERDVIHFLHHLEQHLLLVEPTT